MDNKNFPTHNFFSGQTIKIFSLPANFTCLSIMVVRKLYKIPFINTFSLKIIYCKRIMKLEHRIVICLHVVNEITKSEANVTPENDEEVNEVK